jgi:hypothetical protein
MTQRELPWWHDLDLRYDSAIGYLRELAAKNDALFALRREREAAQRIDTAACDQWLDSHSAADYLPQRED